MGYGAAMLRDPTAARGRRSTDEWNCARPWLWKWRSDAPPRGARTSGGRGGSLYCRDRGSPATGVRSPGRTTRSLHRWRRDRGSRNRRALRSARRSRLLSPGTPRSSRRVPARAEQVLALGERAMRPGVQCRRTAGVSPPRRYRGRAPEGARQPVRDHGSPNLSSRQAQGIQARAALLVCHAEASLRPLLREVR